MRSRLLNLLFAGLVWVSTPSLFAIPDTTFYNDGNLYNYLSNIQATNFINDGIFTTPGSGISQGWLANLYHNWQYTQNFTNNGEMDGESGYDFDTANFATSQPDLEAANFFNTGTINCYGGGIYGGINVFATNIYSSGSITVGTGTYAKFNGDSINFDTGGALSFGSANLLARQSGTYSPNYMFAVSGAATSTNNWSPSQLQSGSASGVMNKTPFKIELNNSVPYFNIRTNSATNILVRMIFIEDDSPAGVANTVAVHSTQNSDGGGHVEWAGTFTDPATGQPITQYFELDDDIFASGSTNIVKFGDPAVGIPDNYTVFASQTSALTNVAAVPGFVDNLLPSSVVTTNNYSYLNLTLSPSDTPLSPLLTSPRSMPGRLEVTAAKSLNLSQAGISGMNYLVLNSTNEFDADAQAALPVPYSDLYLGHTDGNLTLTNLVASTLPVWSGTIQAWSTTWLYADTNGSLPYSASTNTVTYDFRVLLVKSQLIPYTLSQQGSVSVYASNNVTISDALNISSNLFLNCTNLVLTANGVGVGAASVSGQLNCFSTTQPWAAATPNLKELTNNGVVNLSYQNLNAFGSTASPYLALFNGNGATLWTAQGATVNALDFENYGFVSSGLGKLVVQSSSTTMTNAWVEVGGFYNNSAAVNLAISDTSISVGKSLTFSAASLLSLSNAWISVGGAYSNSSAPNIVITGTTINAGTSVAIAAGNSVAANLTISGTSINAGTSLMLAASNQISDGPLTNGNYWVVGANNTTANSTGVVLPVKPQSGDLLGTTVQLLAVTNNKVKSTWAAADRGAVSAGFKNNAALGVLTLVAQQSGSQFVFVGTGTSNALYVDSLEIISPALTNVVQLANVLTLSNNIVIYYAQAYLNSQPVAVKLNHALGDRLRWVPTYGGYFSSVSLVYADGTTNLVNAALAASSFSSNGSGLANNNPNNQAPIYVPSQVNYSMALTNVPPLSLRLQWSTIPNATNFVEYTTNLINWLPFTNFAYYYYGPNLQNVNSNHANWFLSPQPAPGPATNVWLNAPIGNGPPQFYRVNVQPDYLQ